MGEYTAAPLDISPGATIILRRDELAALLTLFGARETVGFAAERLFPADPEARAALVAAGLRELAERGLLPGVCAGPTPDPAWLAPVLRAAMEPVATPRIALLLYRDAPGARRERFVLYWAGATGAELAGASTDEAFRLTPLPDADAVIARALERFPIAGTAMPPTVVRLEQQEFVAFKRFASERPGAAAELLAAHGLTGDLAASLIAAFGHSRFGGSMSVLRTNSAAEEITDARDSAVVQGADSAWLVTQTVPGLPRVTVERTEAARLRDLLCGWLAELATA